jgi:ABC-type antimicrobial peptide transport system permease subunit
MWKTGIHAGGRDRWRNAQRARSIAWLSGPGSGVRSFGTSARSGYQADCPHIGRDGGRDACDPQSRTRNRLQPADRRGGHHGAGAGAHAVRLEPSGLALIGAFAGGAVLLTAIGLYGVLSYAVSQERREIGIRMALGARSSDVLFHILWNALSMVMAGLVLGVPGAIALTRVMKSPLFEVSPLDPIALTIACISIILIGLFAGFLPANRAAHVDPVTTLRDEG